ncbi:MAG TPA: ABC transporter permease [Anaeromyxobacter sp.]|nr:ABC transporter permease [Anaeromyxobacter sp.]
MRAASFGEGAEGFAPAERRARVSRSARPSLSYWADAWIRLRRNRQALLSLAIVIGLFLFATVGPLLWRVDPAEPDLSRISEPPGRGRRATVLPDPPPMEDILAKGVEPHPDGVDGATLPAPSLLTIVGQPTTLSVRLRWSPVRGAAGYRVYRSPEPPGGGYLGLPVGEVKSGNTVSFEDTFALRPRPYYYSVVATNVSDSLRASTLEATPLSAVTLDAARLVRPDAALGQVITFPVRPFGTDGLGRDLLARMMAGAQVTLLTIGFVAPLLSILVGVLIGGVAGYYGGRLDQWLMRFTDFVLSLPFILFLILVRVALGSGPGRSDVTALLVGLVALSWTGEARLVRGQILQLRETEFVEAARLLGAGPARLLARHLLPNTLGVVLVAFTFAVPVSIFTEAFLSFVGMGVSPPRASWGSMCLDGFGTLLTSPHEFVIPALFISVSVLAFNLLGDGLRDALDPRLRSR